MKIIQIIKKQIKENRAKQKEVVALNAKQYWRGRADGLNHLLETIGHEWLKENSFEACDKQIGRIAELLDNN
jgi:hypothetical protein